MVFVFFVYKIMDKYINLNTNISINIINYSIVYGILTIFKLIYLSIIVYKKYKSSTTMDILKRTEQFNR